MSDYFCKFLKKRVTGGVNMPIVFVHGVNNRAGESYNESQAARDGFIRAVVAPALGLDPAEVTLSSPYWGGAGVQFAWNMAVLPDYDASYEAFGNAEPAEVFGRVASAIPGSPMENGGSIVENAKRDFAGMVDLLYASAMAGVETTNEGVALARSYLRAAKYAELNPHPAWLAETVDTNFADQLDYFANEGTEEQFGAAEAFGALKEGLSRLVNFVPDAATLLAARLGRKKLNALVTRFAGDAFTYLARRGTFDAPGEIVQIVLAALRVADAKKTDIDSQLIVVCHSFGGEIVYDILTHFDPALKVDCLITVGSQVGLFEEMKLYVQSKPVAGDVALPPKVARPTSVKRWLNVFDLNDVLSYRVAPVFEGVSDFAYDTGFSTLGAHGGYFERPSFYRRLAARLSEG
jgi:hypothetical protein